MNEAEKKAEHLFGGALKSEIETHPVQFKHTPSRLPKAVTLAAYEVYRELYGSQEAMITAGCRGGFSGGELIAFLYARSFPKHEWQERFSQALQGALDENGYTIKL
jgi:hypothetical protein